MAVYLKYRQISEDKASVGYEIHTQPSELDPITVKVFKAGDAPVPVVTGPKVAANKAIRQIFRRWAREETLPKSGVIQS